MGRHSAPGDDGDVAVDVAEPAAPAAELAGPRGRHSAPDDETSADAGTAADARPTQMIAVVDAELVEAVETHDTQRTDELPAPPLDGPPVEAPPAPSAPSAPSKADAKAARVAEKAQKKAEKAQKKGQQTERKAQRGESGTKADLRLLRKRPIVRLQLVAVVLISFAVYWAVMALLGRTDKFVYWLWVPIVLSGVLIGLVLDLAHRRERRQAPPSDP